MRSSISSSRWTKLLGRSLVLLSCALMWGQTPSSVPANSTPLWLPSAIVYDSVGNLYVSEAQRHTVRKIDTQGRIGTFAGDGVQGFRGDGGLAAIAGLNSPQGLAIDSSGNVFIADSGNHRIRRVNAADGSIATVAGRGAAGFGGDGASATSASLNLPRAICVDPSGNTLYIADTRNHRIRSVDLHSGRITTIAGNGTQGFGGDGGPATGASLDSPSSLVLNAGGDLYIADTRNQRVRRVSATTGIISTVSGVGTQSTAAGGVQSANADLALPRGLAIDAAGNLLIADAGNHRVLRVEKATGLVTGVAGDATQGFSGDGGAATAASLDSPRALAFSPDGLLSIADTGNQRVRQLLAQPAPSTAIETIAGLGAANPGMLSLSVPAIMAYGSGSVAISLNASTSASGTVTLIDAGAASASVIGTAALVGNAASISLASLSAGQRRIFATYAGDATHPAAQTATASISIAPLVLKVTPLPATMIFGTLPPQLGGLVEGVLPQDATRLTVTFLVSASATSPAGAYPISASISGDAAANYTLQTDTGNLVITPAPSSVALRNESADGSFTGTLSALVGSSSSGVPTGSVSLLDNGAAVQQSTVGVAGIASFANVVLAAGSHLLVAAYAGDRNFLPNSSASLPAVVAAPRSGDYILTASNSAGQLLLSGSFVTYTFTVQMTDGGISSPVALSVAGLPAFTKASFSPSYIPPSAAGTTSVVLTVASTASATAQVSTRDGVGAYTVLTLSFPLLGLSLRRLRRWGGGIPALSAAALIGFCGLLTLTGCGDRINTSGQSSSAPQSYTLTVTGTATGSQGATLQHSATVTLKQNVAQ